jgi:hypothetical protein
MVEVSIFLSKDSTVRALRLPYVRMAMPHGRKDYCSPPLAEAREAALDEFLDELNVTAVSEGSA